MNQFKNAVDFYCVCVSNEREKTNNIRMMSICVSSSSWWTKMKGERESANKPAHTHTETDRQFIIFLFFYLLTKPIQSTALHCTSMSERCCLCYLCMSHHSNGGRALTRQFEPFELNFATALSILEMHVWWFHVRLHWAIQRVLFIQRD